MTGCLSVGYPLVTTIPTAYDCTSIRDSNVIRHRFAVLRQRKGAMQA